MPPNRSFTELPHAGEQITVVTPVIPVTLVPELDHEGYFKYIALVIMVIIPASIAGVIFLIGMGLVR